MFLQNSLHKNTRLLKKVGIVIKLDWISRSSRRDVFYKKGVQENTCARVSFSIKLQTSETVAQLFSSELFEISKNTFSYRTPPVAASKYP